MRQRHLATGLERHAAPAAGHPVRLLWRRYNRAAKRGGPQVETALEELGECLPAPGRPEDRLEERETADLISRFLREQPQLDRVLFLRRYWYLDSVAALAERFSMNENTVKSRLHRTRLRLKEVLLREGVAV